MVIKGGGEESFLGLSYGSFPDRNKMDIEMVSFSDANYPYGTRKYSDSMEWL